MKRKLALMCLIISLLLVVSVSAQDNCPEKISDYKMGDKCWCGPDFLKDKIGTEHSPDAYLHTPDSEGYCCNGKYFKNPCDSYGDGTGYTIRTEVPYDGTCRVETGSGQIKPIYCDYLMYTVPIQECEESLGEDESPVSACDSYPCVTWCNSVGLRYIPGFTFCEDCNPLFLEENTIKYGGQAPINSEECPEQISDSSAPYCKCFNDGLMVLSNKDEGLCLKGSYTTPPSAAPEFPPYFGVVALLAAILAALLISKRKH